ncbi:MAG: AAA family ATPase [Lachnospiraceae bacterium]|nr:AAA family ATPase [Lachnospiraceae bacterium]
MKLIACHIENFGILHDLHYEFSAGENVIIKENGWGKSTFAAFLRAMLYGLEGSRKKGAENERRYYAPWQGGVFGGSLTFEAEGESYTITRIFGKKDSDDEFELRNARNNLVSKKYSEKIGEELFRLSRESFSRTVFISQTDCETAVNADMHARVASLTDNAHDMNSFETASGLLKARLNALTPGRKTGAISQRESEMAGLRLEIHEAGDPGEKLKNELETLQALEEEKEAREAYQKKLQEEQEEASYRAGLEEQRKRWEALKNRVGEKEKERAAAEKIFPGRIPSSVEADGMIEKLNEASRIREKNGLLSEKEEEDLSGLSVRFAEGLPEDEAMAEAKKLSSLWETYEEALQLKSLSPAEKEEYLALKALYRGRTDDLRRAFDKWNERNELLSGAAGQETMLALLKRSEDARKEAEEKRREAERREAERKEAEQEKAERIKAQQDEERKRQLEKMARTGLLVAAGGAVVILCALLLFLLKQGAAVAALLGAGTFLTVSGLLLWFSVRRRERKELFQQVLSEGDEAGGAGEEELAEQGVQTENPRPLYGGSPDLPDKDGGASGKGNGRGALQEALQNTASTDEDLQDTASLEEEIRDKRAAAGRTEEETKELLLSYGLPWDPEIAGEDIRRLGAGKARYEVLRDRAEDEEAQELAEKKQETVLKLAALLPEWIAKDSADPSADLRELENAADRYADLYARKLRQMKEEEKAAALEKQAREFLDSCRIAAGDDLYRKLRAVYDRADDFEDAVRDLREARQELSDFEAAHDMQALLPEEGAEREKPAEREPVRSLADILEESRRNTKRRDELTESIHEKKAETARLLQKKEELEEKKEQLSRLEALQEEERLQYRYLELARTHLEKARQNLMEKYADPLLSSFAAFYETMTGEKASAFHLDADTHLTFSEKGRQRETVSLSRGYRDLAGICLRTALAEAMFTSEKPFLVLDDPFTNLDDEKVERGMHFLKKLSEEYQILYLTCSGSRT